MFTARIERPGSLSTHLGSPARRPVVTDRSRPSNRSFQGVARSLFLDADPMTNLTTLRGSMFESSAPQRA